MQHVFCHCLPFFQRHASKATCLRALAGIAAERYVSVTPPVMQKITGLGTCGPATLAAEVALPPPADLLRLPPGQLSRVLVLDGVQVRGVWVAALLARSC